MAPLDWSQCPAVESIPDKVSGAWVFKGTRLPVATIIENLEDLSVDEVIEQFDVTREQVTAVLEFVILGDGRKLVFGASEQTGPPSGMPTITARRGPVGAGLPQSEAAAPAAVPPRRHRVRRKSIQSNRRNRPIFQVLGQSAEERLVTRTFASWNRIGKWLSQLEALRRAG
jgi:uncharacterized protein (DUF433 family)